jgi:ferredoxin
MRNPQFSRLSDERSSSLNNAGASPLSTLCPNSTLTPWNASTCGACVPVCPVSAIFALDDLPEKWKQYTELNESYVKAGKYTPEEFAKHQNK